MKLNRKGMTLVEIILSVGLIAMVMVFLFRILIDVRHESATSATNSKDMINRSEIISKIQDRLDLYYLRAVSINNTSADEVTVNLHLTQKSDNGLYYIPIHVKKKSLTMYVWQTWELQDPDAEYDLCNITTELVHDPNQPNSHYYVRVLIPVKLKNREDHSPYDIEISYIGNKANINFNASNYQSGKSC